LKIHRREQIQRSLRSLAESYSATMHLMEETLSLLCDELALDPVTYFRTRPVPATGDASTGKLKIDPALLTVTCRGKVCFLGNTLPFKFLVLLARRCNTYVAYDDLLAEVWEGDIRSKEAVRSVAKTLRSRLRQAGLRDVADAIDGTVRGHYALKLAL